MYDSTDGKKAGILKNVGSTASDSIYSHKDSITFSNNQPLRYVEAPGFKEPIIMNTPRYPPPINPDYLKLAQIGYDMILQTMIEGEKEHGADEWKSKEIAEHYEHAVEHLCNIGECGCNNPMEELAHAMTRCAIIKMLEDEHEQKNR